MPEGEKLFAVGKIETGNLTSRERALKYFLAQSIASLIYFMFSIILTSLDHCKNVSKFVNIV